VRLHAFEHAAFEGLGEIGSWAGERGHELKRSRLYAGDPLPEPGSFDWLIVMGGPMGVHEEDRFPWLRAEKAFIRQAAERGNRLLGICLGAQLIAEALGGEVLPNPEREIGWHPVFKSAGAERSSFSSLVPARFQAFHWHGDTFRPPPGSVRLAESEGCADQAFSIDGRILGLQFHLEITPKGIADLVDNCGGDLTEGLYVQAAGSLIPEPDRFKEARLLLNRWLEFLAGGPS